VYGLPAGTTATPNTNIESAKYNAFLADLVNDLNAARPIVAGGTGATTKTGAQQALDLEPGVDIQAYNAKLAALAALTLAADKLIYATGANTLAAADLTAFARTLLAGADAAAVRTLLALGDMATKDDVAIADIDATGTPSASTFLRGDGVWIGATQTGPVAVNSGTAVSLASGLPVGITWLDIYLDRIQAGSANDFQIQLGDSGGLITTGYESNYQALSTTGVITSGFGIKTGGANRMVSGVARFRKLGSLWVHELSAGVSSAGACQGGGVLGMVNDLASVSIGVLTSGSFNGSGAAYLRYGQ